LIIDALSLPVVATLFGTGHYFSEGFLLPRQCYQYNEHYAELGENKPGAKNHRW
jgi:hypothetical protein